MRPGIACLILCAVAPVASAQEARVLDRIVAVVGTKPLLASQVEEEIVQLQAQGQQVPSDSAALTAFRRQLLERMVEEELLVQQAERDSAVHVTEQEVQEQVETSVQNVRRNFSSETEFQQQLKLANFGSVDEWRRYLAERQRRSILRDRLVEVMKSRGKLKPIVPSDAEMRAYWEQNRGQLPKRPALVSFRQIVVAPRADSAARVRAYQRAESLRVELTRGADFADVAKRFSDDSTTRPNGGELGWFRRGVMVKAFESVAFRLRPGEISPIVETDYGFHIIQVTRVQPAEIFARHVLLTPAISPAQVEVAHRLADSVHVALARGASFDSLARRYARADEPKLAEDVPFAQLPEAYQRAIGDDTTRGWKPVFTMDSGTARVRFVVLELTRRQREGEPTFEDLKDRIRQALSQQLAIDHYLTQLRHTTYVDIRL